MPVTLKRLKCRRDFLRVAAKQKKWAAPGLILQAAPGPEGAPAVRVGFTVSKKVGNAVRRNRARRRLRAAVAEVMGDCAAPGHDYVVIGRAATLNRPYKALLDDLRVALSRVLTIRSGSRFLPREKRPCEKGEGGGSREERR